MVAVGTDSCGAGCSSMLRCEVEVKRLSHNGGGFFVNCNRELPCSLHRETAVVPTYPDSPTPQSKEPLETPYERFHRIAVIGLHRDCFRAGQHICGKDERNEPR